MGGISIIGLDQLLKRLDGKEFGYKVQYALNNFAENTVADAVKLAPVDEGHLKESINYDKSSDHKNGASVAINVNANYAAYLEFGTRKFAAFYIVGLPSDWKSYAAQFKGGGGGGDYFDFLNAILDWVVRKGIANRYSVKTQKKININLEKPSKSGVGKGDYERLHDVAYGIALSIMRKGIKAHPFLYPAFEKNRQQLLDDIKAIEL